IEHRIKQVEEKFGFDHGDETRIVGIVGMPGIGKTTLATELFNKYKNKFIRCNFLKIRGKLAKMGAESSDDRLRTTFLEGLLPNIDVTDDCVKSKLLSNKVFVVLDDVSSKEHIEILLGDRSWIKKGSRIVITTRDRALITDLDPNPYVVLGRELLGKGEAFWNAPLDTLAKCPNKSIQNLLKISYDELSEKEKDAFLDIACFFRSEDEFYARSLLDSEVASEITDLAYKFLISISGGRVEMHDLLHTFALELCSLSSTK
ncbi:unnamed protein product, partial [Brassica rapa subsp. trilocularis]